MLLNDPNNGLDGVESSFQEIGPTEFNSGERILITVDEPTSGDVVGVDVFSGGRSNLSRSVTSLPTTFEVWGLGADMRWQTVTDPAGGDGTVTWQTECVPAPIVSATAECRAGTGVIIVAIEDRAAAAYQISTAAGRPTATVMSVAGERVVFESEPFDDGSWEVVVEPVEDRRIELIWTNVTVDCATPPSTTQPVVTTTPVVDLDPNLPETGGSETVSRWLLGMGTALVFGGALLLRLRRPPA
jgi:hypothetical protein